MILLVINTQKLITNENLYKFNEFVSNVEKIIATARQNNIVKNIKGRNLICRPFMFFN